MQKGTNRLYVHISKLFTLVNPALAHHLKTILILIQLGNSRFIADNSRQSLLTNVKYSMVQMP